MGEGITDRDVGRHVARFMLVGVYTGTRHGAICSAALTPAVGRGYVDTDSGVLYRRRQGSRQTKKRQPPVKLPPGLLGPPAALETAWYCSPRGRRVERQAGGVGPEVVRVGGARGRHRSPHHAAHLPSHGGDLGDAAGLRYLGGGRLPRHEPGAFRARVRSPSSGLPERRRCSNVGTETGQKRREQNGTSDNE